MLFYKTILHPESNEWCVFIHGFGGAEGIFKKQMAAFEEKYNCLYIHLHGHGKTKIKLQNIKEPSFNLIANDILDILDKIDIKVAHFIGISLGTIVLNAISRIAPHRMKTMVLGGAVIKYKKYVRNLFKMGILFEKFIPHALINRSFGWLMMPKRNHKKLRDILHKEIIKLGHTEYVTWGKIITYFDLEFKPEEFCKVNVPKLYIMGRQDHMFLENIIKYSNQDKNSSLHIIEGCGHLCNMENPSEFNHMALHFINSI